MSVLKVRCSDGLLVEVDAEVALKVGTLKDLLFASELPLKNVSSETLEKIVKAAKTPENTLAKVNLLTLFSFTAQFTNTSNDLPSFSLSGWPIP